jgi:hypothetical protein
LVKISINWDYWLEKQRGYQELECFFENNYRFIVANPNRMLSFVP